MKLLKFLLIFLLVDQLLGYGVHQLFLSQDTGKFARSSYVINDSNDEVLLFGSSHMVRQYVPEIITKKTGLTCYNAGAEGQQLLYHTALLQMVLKRTTPKLVVLNIDEHWLFESDVAYSRLNDLNAYYSYHKDVLYPKLKEKSTFVPVKMFFKGYQKNSTLVHVVRYFFSPQGSFNGYKPLYGKMQGPSNKSHNNEALSENIDLFLVQNLELFINLARENGVKLLFVNSPYPEAKDFGNNKSLQKIKQIAKENKIPFYDHLNDGHFVGNYAMFNDPMHLNNEGSEKFTGLVADHINMEFPDLVNDSK
ncbi:hypothetical protein GWK10_06605 [Spongiivirga citrea]|uniref:SGNH/GDSL hydrolase family protein n=1 Tax=Spongiivirga citrea TaxID=1481457 RepID=A0A6M0CIS3_9FLAO|nr:hypothetical protein [Spongiivirga citrea]